VGFESPPSNRFCFCPRSSMDQSARLRNEMLGVRLPPWVPKVSLSMSPSWIGHPPTKRDCWGFESLHRRNGSGVGTQMCFISTSQ
jgi:hypothetical protein